MNNPENENTSQMNDSFQPEQQPDPMKSSTNPPPPMYGASPSMPNQHQPYAGPPDAVPMKSQQTTFIRNVQHVNEPAYLGYSIFTLLCCCPPLGIAALIYSLRTQKANRRRDVTSAKKYSRLALTLDNIALGLGIATIVLSIIGVSISNIIAHNSDEQKNSEDYNP